MWDSTSVASIVNMSARYKMETVDKRYINYIKENVLIKF